MTDYFLDASAAVKRYADEAGSTWIRQITEPQAGNTILLAEITLAEVAAALAAARFHFRDPPDYNEGDHPS